MDSPAVQSTIRSSPPICSDAVISSDTRSASDTSFHDSLMGDLYVPLTSAKGGSDSTDEPAVAAAHNRARATASARPASDRSEVAA